MNFKIKININCETCGVSRYCGTMVGSIRLHNSIIKQMETNCRKVYEALRDLKMASVEELSDALNITQTEVKEALYQMQDKIEYYGTKYKKYKIKDA